MYKIIIFCYELNKRIGIQINSFLNIFFFGNTQKNVYELSTIFTILNMFTATGNNVITKLTGLSHNNVHTSKPETSVSACAAYHL